MVQWWLSDAPHHGFENGNSSLVAYAELETCALEADAGAELYVAAERNVWRSATYSSWKSRVAPAL